MNILKEQLLQMGFKQQGEEELLLILPSPDKYFGEGAISIKSPDWDALEEKIEVTILNDKAEEVAITHRVSRYRNFGE